MTILFDHFAAIESVLLAQAGIQASAGHALHKGTPREKFIGEFLQSHLSERIAIGTGEVVCSSSTSGESRNQHDIVLYKRDYPKLDLGGGINAFLVESLAATIEVKSTLTKDELKKAFAAAKRLKSLPRSEVRAFSAGYQPPSSLCFVVAYDGPASMNTVYGWLSEIHRELDLDSIQLGATRQQRSAVVAPGIDGIFVLGRGFLVFDNTPYSFLDDAACAQNPDVSWVYADLDKGNLLVLFTTLTVAVSGVAGAWLNPAPYLTGLSLGEGDLKGGSGV